MPDTTKRGDSPRTPGGDLFVVTILDRSGSMGSIRDDVIGGFNGFLEDLRGEEGRTLMTLVQFDTESIDVLCDAIPVQEVRPLSSHTYQPRGGTPLLDAMGLTLGRTEVRIAEQGWTAPVLVAVITDGAENASREWTGELIAARVKELEAGNWAFLYLGAHADSFTESARLGIDPSQTAVWGKHARGTRAMGESLYDSQAAWRRGIAKEELISKASRDRMRGDDA